ncbi:probable transcription factor At1g61730 [Punica granatum]|uniref:Probable transcription factor At1g61730 n=3 Tax=Punica granatum TaxID=22663 RepID=A0A6P8CJ92_PUNGR|nr:probable transcription factor At1g61730 [Punica granatum]
MWSEPEEMEVMKGLVEVSKSKPKYELNDIYESIKQKIPSSVSKRQLSGKIRNLKKKFKSRDKKVKEGAELSPQEENFLELAVKAWGSVENLVKGRTAAKKPVKGKAAAARGLEGHVGTSVSALSRRLLKGIEDVGGGRSLNEEFVRKKTYLVDERMRVELDQQWKRLEEQELQLIVERARLINDHAAVICQTRHSLGS